MDKQPQRLYHQGVNAGSWYCIHIDHPRLVSAVDVTFRNMLVGEFIEMGEPANCRVYRKTLPNGSYCYFFSPEASERFRVLVNFWDGVEVPVPQDLGEMAIVL